MPALKASVCVYVLVSIPALKKKKTVYVIMLYKILLSIKKKKLLKKKKIKFKMPCWQSLENVDSVSCKGVRPPPPPPPPKRRAVLGITLNSIWWWGSSSRALRTVENPLHCHYSQVLWLEMAVFVRVASMGQIDLFEKYLY